MENLSMLYHYKNAGFTLIELMITVAIVGILAAIAVPSYQNYTRKAYYSEIVLAASPYRLAVGMCAQTLGTLNGCDAGSNGIPAAIAAPVGAVASLTVTKGVITVIPTVAHGILATDTYVLTPTVDAATGTITWVSSGGGVSHHYTQ